MSTSLTAYGYTEATHAPDQHHCSDNLVEAVIDPPTIVLMCYTCRSFWYTGITEAGYHSLASIIQAANRLYRKEAA